MATTHSNNGRESARRTTHEGGKKAAPKRAATDKRPRSSSPESSLSDQEWHEMVAVAAYFRGQARGPDGASADDDWYEAEAELRAQLTASGSGADIAPGQPKPRKQSDNQSHD